MPLVTLATMDKEITRCLSATTKNLFHENLKNMYFFEEFFGIGGDNGVSLLIQNVLSLR
jgi:hypothetical protein